MRVIIGILFFGLLVGCGSSEDNSSSEPVDDSGHSSEMEMASANPAQNMSLYQLESDWSNHDNITSKLDVLAGRFQVVAMAYTSCEVACPRIVASMKKIQKEVDSDRVGFTIISIDPERDTPATLKAYADKMDLNPASWTLLTSKSDNVLELAALLGVRYRALPGGEFAHSNIISVLDETGVLVHQQNGLGPDLTENTIAMIDEILES